MSPWIAQRQIGRLTATIITEGSARFLVGPILKGDAGAIRAEVPMDEEGWTPLEFNFLHVAAPGASILVDAGFGDQDPGGASAHLAAYQLTPGLEAGLVRAGVDPARISHLLITHMHGDHFVGALRPSAGGWLPRFPQARVIVTRTEWESSPQPTMLGDVIGQQMPALVAAGLLELVDGEREVAPGVIFVPAPGETPGSAIVRVADAGETLYYLGDLAHVAAELVHPDWYLGRADPAVLEATRRRILERALEEGSTLLLTHHDFPGALIPRRQGGGVTLADGSEDWHRIA